MRQQWSTRKDCLMNEYFEFSIVFATSNKKNRDKLEIVSFYHSYVFHGG